MKFELRIHITTDSETSVKWAGSAYYTNIHFDSVKITNGLISISGHRSSRFDLKRILYNSASTLYYQIVKVLAFYYLCSGYPLLIDKMELSSDIFQTETETDFLQPFKKNLCPYQVMSENELENLFSFQGEKQLFLTCIICYINAIQDNSFENYWKSFNSLYSILKHEGTEFDKLKTVRSFVESHSNRFANTLAHINLDTSADIRKLRIREFILNDWPTISHTKAFADTVQRFSDIRIIRVFEETLPYRIDFLRNQGLDTSVQNYITTCKKQNKTDNVELLCFYILKYSYFIRNKYFHAEKAYPYFILKKTAEIEEMHRISEVFSCFLADFIRCNELYL